MTMSHADTSYVSPRNVAPLHGILRNTNRRRPRLRDIRQCLWRLTILMMLFSCCGCAFL
jgi:hypothetical protein